MARVIRNSEVERLRKRSERTERGKRETEANDRIAGKEEYGKRSEGSESDRAPGRRETDKENQTLLHLCIVLKDPIMDTSIRTLKTAQKAMKS